MVGRTGRLAARNRFPSLRLPVLIEKDPIGNAAGVAGEELIVPYLRSRFETFETLRIAKQTYQFILVQVANAGLESLYTRMMLARSRKSGEKNEG